MFIICLGKIDLKTSKTNKDKFERNRTDVFSIDADVGALTKIRFAYFIFYIQTKYVVYIL